MKIILATLGLALILTAGNADDVKDSSGNNYHGTSTGNVQIKPIGYIESMSITAILEVRSYLHDF